MIKEKAILVKMEADLGTNREVKNRMIVKDLLSQCSIDDVVSEIMRISGVSEEKREKVYAVHDSVFGKLRMIEPVITEYVILGIPYLNDGSRTNDVCLFSKSEIKAEFTKSCVLDNIKSIEALTNEEIETVLQTFILPDSYGFEFSPWEEVLGYQVAEKNLKELGGVCILARVIYEMTFFGFTEEQVDMERKKLDEALTESEKIQSLPPEEQEKHYIPAEKAFKMLGHQDRRTPEEKEEDRQKQRREILFNQLQKYRALNMYMETEEFNTERASRDSDI